MANSGASFTEDLWEVPTLETVVAQTEPLTGQPPEGQDDGYGYDRPIGRIVLEPTEGQPTEGQPAEGQPTASGTLTSLGSWNVQPLPSIDVQAAGQSDGQSSIGTWIMPELGSSREK